MMPDLAHENAVKTALEIKTDADTQVMQEVNKIGTQALINAYQRGYAQALIDLKAKPSAPVAEIIEITKEEE